MDSVTTIIEKIKTLEGEELARYWGALIRERRTKDCLVSKDPGLAFYKEMPTEVKMILVNKFHELTKAVSCNEFIEMLH
jgi:hypothetical protein